MALQQPHGPVELQEGVFVTEGRLCSEPPEDSSEGVWVEQIHEKA